MLEKKLSVSIGIPAYNEEANIKQLLEALLKQKQEDYVLTQIIVANDGSVDKTIAEASSINDARIMILNDNQRQGQYFRQNQIIDHFKGDVLVLLNADMVPKNEFTINSIVRVFSDPKIGLASGRVEPLPSNNFFEKVINYSVEIKDYIASNLNNGKNILTCRGAYRAFSKEFLTGFRFPKVVNEDAYTYLWCINNGYKYSFVADSVILYRSPDNAEDHKRQSRRFINGQEGLKQYFNPEQVIKEHHVPFLLLLKASVIYFFKNPILFSTYFFNYVKIRLFNKKNTESVVWPIAVSTKKLRNDPISRKIEVVSTFFYPVVAGQEINVLNTYSYFVEQGWEVIVYTTKDDINLRNAFNDRDEINGIKVIRKNYFSFAFTPFSLGLSYNSNGIIALHDFISFPDIFICLYTWFLKILGKKKYQLVLTSHGMFNNTMLGIYKGIKPRLKKYFDSTLGVFIINRSVDKIRTVSHNEKSSLVKTGIESSKIIVIGNGIEDVAYQDISDESISFETKKLVENAGDYILSVSRIDRLKNIETTIRSLAKLSNNIKLIIVGPVHDPEYKKRLLTIITELGINNRVIFAGKISGADKYYIMKHCRVFVHMALSEGFGNVVHEAMSQGCICVVSKGTALEELVKDGNNGFVVDPYDVDKLSTIINQIVTGFTGTNEIKQRNLTATKGHSWNDVAKKVEEYYFDV